MIDKIDTYVFTLMAAITAGFGAVMDEVLLLYIAIACIIISICINIMYLRNKRVI